MVENPAWDSDGLVEKPGRRALTCGALAFSCLLRWFLQVCRWPTVRILHADRQNLADSPSEPCADIPRTPSEPCTKDAETLHGFDADPSRTSRVFKCEK